MEKIRLDKLLANAGAGTRSEVKTAIRKGRVTVNGACCRQADTKIDYTQDIICLDGQMISYQEFEYYMLHKPAGCVTATEDALHPTVMDYVSSVRKRELFPVGRLDIDTEGLLLITNDGDLAHRLLAPGKHVDKTYFARIAGAVNENDVRCFAGGLDIGDDRPALPAVLKVLSSGSISEVLITIQEGRFHQIKRMFQAVKKEVIYLKRLSMGSLVLDETLPPGGCRALTEEEIQQLLNGVNN